MAAQKEYSLLCLENPLLGTFKILLRSSLAARGSSLPSTTICRCFGGLFGHFAPLKDAASAINSSALC